MEDKYINQREGEHSHFGIIICLIALIYLIVVGVIFFQFKNNWCKWGKPDFGSYFGGIFGGIATLIAVVLPFILHTKIIKEGLQKRRKI